MRIFDRLVGLETEYAIRFVPDAGRSIPSRLAMFRQVVEALRTRIPIAEAQHFKDGVFAANSGAVWFEAVRMTAHTGLVEGATPECRGPRQVVAYQRAQDRLLSEACAAAAVPGTLSLLKNDRDADGNIYGAQENYEATIATGWRLFVWRLGLVALLPAALLAWIGMLLLIVLGIAYLATAHLIVFLANRLSDGRWRWERWLLHPEWGERELSAEIPPWLEMAMMVGAQLTSLPLSVLFHLLAHVTAFVPQRRALEAFLASRAVICGTGMLDEQGNFWLADKAPSVNCWFGYGDLLLKHPVFNFGHFLKAMCAEVPLQPREFLDLMARRQRLQISLGDSNMSESAEFLRVGTTILVLDMVESGVSFQPPRLRRPLAALRTLSGDPTLDAAVACRDGLARTALEIQRIYASACWSFLRNQTEVPQEAWQTANLWLDVLDQLEERPEDLVGTLDWVTKRRLLDDAGHRLDWDARKKIDLRYHELTRDGYFRQLDDRDLVRHIASPHEIERAMRSPPPDSPATVRGHFIREFAVGDQPVRVNWKRVILGKGRRAKVVRLSKYRRPGATV